MEYVLDKALNPVNSKEYKSQGDIRSLISKARQVISKMKVIQVRFNLQK